MVLIRTHLKRLKRRLLRRKNRPFLVIGLFAVLILSMALYSNLMSKHIDPSAYRGLLDTIAASESSGNYNAYFANSANTELRLTHMSVAEVVQWQKDYVQAGQPSNAVGRYQIIQPTLEGLVKEMKLSPSTIFNEIIQDTMAIRLMERRGAVEFVKGNLSAEEFAANLAKEWAALPRITGDNPSVSFYAGDGLNASRISVDAMLGAVKEFKKAAE